MKYETNLKNKHIIKFKLVKHKNCRKWHIKDKIKKSNQERTSFRDGHFGNLDFLENAIDAQVNKQNIFDQI